jgi:hypothetical protein
VRFDWLSWELWVGSFELLSESSAL